MNVTSNSQQLISSASESAVNTTGIKAFKDRTKQLKANSAGTPTQSVRKSDNVQISKMGAELSRAASADSGISSMAPSTAKSSEEKRISSGGIENVMARYKEAQNFMSQIEPVSIDSTA